MYIETKVQGRFYEEIYWRDIGHRDFSSWLESHQDPGKILARKRNSQRPKSCWDPTANLAKILAEEQIHSGKNLGAILPGILPRLATGSEILGEIHSGNLLQFPSVRAQCLRA